MTDLDSLGYAKIKKNKKFISRVVKAISNCYNCEPRTLERVANTSSNKESNSTITSPSTTTTTSTQSSEEEMRVGIEKRHFLKGSMRTLKEDLASPGIGWAEKLGVTKQTLSRLLRAHFLTTDLDSIPYRDIVRNANYRERAEEIIRSCSNCGN